jgi:hypothetical protein
MSAFNHIASVGVGATVLLDVTTPSPTLTDKAVGLLASLVIQLIITGVPKLVAKLKKRKTPEVPLTPAP